MGAARTYSTLRHGGEEVAILYMQQPEARAAGAPPHWTSYISVEDADATLREPVSRAAPRSCESPSTCSTPA